MENKTLIAVVMSSVVAVLTTVSQEPQNPTNDIHESSIAACYDAKTCDQCKGPQNIHPS